MRQVKQHGVACYNFFIAFTAVPRDEGVELSSSQTKEKKVRKKKKTHDGFK